jgi:hypothetical protein
MKHPDSLRSNPGRLHGVPSVLKCHPVNVDHSSGMETVAGLEFEPLAAEHEKAGSNPAFSCSSE